MDFARHCLIVCSSRDSFPRQALGLDAVALAGGIWMPARDIAAPHAQGQLGTFARGTRVAEGLVQRAHIGAAGRAYQAQRFDLRGIGSELGNLLPRFVLEHRVKLLGAGGALGTAGCECLGVSASRSVGPRFAIALLHGKPFVIADRRVRLR
jgi:hypothetical protein